MKDLPPRYGEFGFGTNAPLQDKAWKKWEAGRESTRNIAEGVKAKRESEMNINWHKRLDPKDMSAVLQEEKFWMTGPKSAPRCSEAILKLRDELKAEIADEKKGGSLYGNLSDRLDLERLPIFSEALHDMSADEFEHAGILNAIVDIITERCSTHNPTDEEVSPPSKGPRWNIYGPSEPPDIYDWAINEMKKEQE